MWVWVWCWGWVGEEERKGNREKNESHGVTWMSRHQLTVILMSLTSLSLLVMTMT